MPRKKLNDNEDAFIKGSSESPAKKASAKRTPKKATKTEDIVSQILKPAPPVAKEPTVRFTADLPVELHRRLTRAAAQADKKKVDIVRELLEAVLPE